VTYRLLDVAEWEHLAPEFTSRGVSLPDPRFSMIVGAIDDQGTLAGFVVCKMQMHCEPLVVYNPHCLRGLMRAADAEILDKLGPTDAYVFTSGYSADIAETWGAKELDEKIWVKRIK
jgi:hypothetical protein